MKFRFGKRLRVNGRYAVVFAIFLVLTIFTIYLNKDYLTKLAPPENPQSAFLGEVYDKIKDNYWDKINDAKLSELFRLATEKALGTQGKQPATKQEVIGMITQALQNQPQEQRKDKAASIANLVLANLQPFGRSGLYTQKLETQLKNTVQNINPEKDLYKDLGLPKSASVAAVEQAYQKKSAELSTQPSSQAKEQLKEASYAYQTLKDQDNKASYDQSGVEPTIFTKLYTPDIAYIQFKKFSPTSLDEFQKALNSFDKPDGPRALILDLRGNIGGAIDALPYFLGDLLGKNQYAFDFYHQGNFTPFKTSLDQLPVMSRLRQMVVLVDNQTQSSAELLAASIKKYHLGIVVGTATRGWGTVEKVFPLDHQIDKDEKYSVFLVHSITLRDDNQPIEGRGVSPNVDIKDPNWEANLYSYFRYPELISILRQLIYSPS